MIDINQELKIALEQLKKYKYIRLEKECKGEYIIITFLSDGDKVFKKLKTYYSKDKTTLRKQKEYTLTCCLYFDIIDKDVYELITNYGYKIIKEKDEKNGK